jgi:hypothetical protein
MRRRTIEEKYLDNLGKQRRELEEFAEHEFEWAKDMMIWYKHNKKDMPDDEYRACAFFLNKEYLRKPGSLTILYKVSAVSDEANPVVTRENAFDVLRFKYRLFAKALEKGGF